MIIAQVYVRLTAPPKRSANERASDGQIRDEALRNAFREFEAKVTRIVNGTPDH
jgi:hypothetical protein